jgi:hypothetical protein
MSTTLGHVHRGFSAVRPYLHGPEDLPSFLENTFGAVILETNTGGPSLLQIGDSLIWSHHVIRTSGPACFLAAADERRERQ